MIILIFLDFKFFHIADIKYLSFQMNCEKIKKVKVLTFNIKSM